MTRRLAALSLLVAATAFAANPVAVTDDLGQQTCLAVAPLRIVSLAPSNTELLFALGLGDRVVGVTEYCNWPEAAARIEKVAGYTDLSVEKIAAVRPDLVVAARGNDLEGLETLRRLGIPVFAFAANGVDDVLRAVDRLGQLTGQTDGAQALETQLRARVEAVRRRVQGRPRPLVLWGFAADPIYTAGAGSLIDDVIEQAGGSNAGRRAAGLWPQVSLETVVGWAPDVLLMSPSTDAAGELAQLRTLDGWRDLPAVRSGRVVRIDGDLLTRAGPRLVDALEQLAAQLHPDVAARPVTDSP